MPPQKEPTVQLVILAIIMVVLILIVVLVFIFRFALFGPKDLSIYGTRGDAQVSTCHVPGKTLSTTLCSDTGVQLSVSQCIPNSITGYMCYNSNTHSQDFTSEVTVSSCIPACMSFLWEQTVISPCLIDNGAPITNGVPNDYATTANQWCHQDISGTRFRVWNCDRRDGSGINMCTYTCDNSSTNIDCYQGPLFQQSSSGVTLMYDPIITPSNTTIDLANNGSVYTYTPISKADVAFPVIASSVMVTKEACTDLGGFTCGSWQPSSGNAPISDNNSQQLSADCNVVKNIADAVNIGYPDGTQEYDYNALAVNTIYNLFEPGIHENILSCFDIAGTPAPRCDPDQPGCILPEDIFIAPDTIHNNIVKLVVFGATIPGHICGLSTKDSNGIVTSIQKNVSSLNSCVFVNPNFSATPNANLTPTPTMPLIDANVFVFDNSAQDTKIEPPFIAGIFGVPLFIKMASGGSDYYLTLFNNPCPEYDISILFNGGFLFSFTPGGSFIEGGIDPIPTTGLPFRFDCKGNPYGVIENTPTVWLEDILNVPSEIYGISPACDNRTNDMSPIIEQTALFVMLRPAILDVGEVLPANTIKCNMFAIFGSNYIGWLAWQNGIGGYAGGDDNTKQILTWVQGRFDPYGNAAPGLGTRIENIPNSNFYLTRQNSTDYTYTLSSTPPSNPIDIFNSLDNSLNPMGVFTFKRATSNGLPIVNNNNVINETVFANFLYSRQNRGTNPTFTFPACNVNLVQS